MAQTLKPMEIIVVDAGSTDSSQDIIKGYTNRGIRLVVSEGCSYSEGEKLAVDMTKGDFMAVTNTDVYVPPNWLERSYMWYTKGYEIVGVLRINTGDVYSFSWNNFHEDEPWETEREGLGLSSDGLFIKKQTREKLNPKNLLNSPDVEIALGSKLSGKRMIIDPKIAIIHDDPLKSTSNSFRKSMVYGRRHILLIREAYGKMVVGESAGIHLPIRGLAADLLGINAVKAYKMYKPIMGSVGIQMGCLHFVGLRMVYKLGQLTGIMRGLLGV